MHDTSDGNTHPEQLDSFLKQLDRQIIEHTGRRTDLRNQVGHLLRQLEAEDRILAAAFELHHRMTGTRHTRNEFQVSRRVPLGKGSPEPASLPDDADVTSGMSAATRRTVPPTGRLRDVYDILRTSDGPVRLTDLTTQLQENGRLDGVDNPTPAIAAALSRGVKLGMFDRVARGMYTVRSENEEPS